MGILTPRPSQVETHFRELYRDAPEKATNWYHSLGVATGYTASAREGVLHANGGLSGTFATLTSGSATFFAAV